MFEVNFWGAVHVSQEAIRFFREENVPQGGHLIQNSAGAGFFGFELVCFREGSGSGEPEADLLSSIAGWDPSSLSEDSSPPTRARNSSSTSAMVKLRSQARLVLRERGDWKSKGGGSRSRGWVRVVYSLPRL